MVKSWFFFRSSFMFYYSYGLAGAVLSKDTGRCQRITEVHLEFWSMYIYFFLEDNELVLKIH